MWDDLSNLFPGRIRLLDRLQWTLEEVEGERAKQVEEALAQMVAEMNDIAHVSPGEVERIMQEAAMALNASILEHR